MENKDQLVLNKIERDKKKRINMEKKWEMTHTIMSTTWENNHTTEENLQLIIITPPIFNLILPDQ